MQPGMRWIVALLLAVALPLQGLAAATMLHGAFATPAAAAATAAGFPAAPAQAHLHHHADSGAEPGHTLSAGLATGDGVDPGAPCKRHGGATCCAVAALPAAPFAFAAGPPRERFADLAWLPLPPVIVAGLERPPRSAFR